MFQRGEKENENTYIYTYVGARAAALPKSIEKIIRFSKNQRSYAESDYRSGKRGRCIYIPSQVLI